MGPRQLRPAGRRRGNAGFGGAGPRHGRPLVRRDPRVRLAHLRHDALGRRVLLGLQSRRPAGRWFSHESPATGVRRTAARHMTIVARHERSLMPWKRARRVAAWIAVSAAAACSGGGADVVTTGTVASVSITPPTTTVSIGAQIPLQALVQDQSGKTVTGDGSLLVRPGPERRDGLQRGRRDRRWARVDAGRGEREREVGHCDDHRREDAGGERRRHAAARRRGARRYRRSSPRSPMTPRRIRSAAARSRGARATGRSPPWTRMET